MAGALFCEFARSPYTCIHINSPLAKHLPISGDSAEGV